jgi:hypothetical protein
MWGAVWQDEAAGRRQEPAGGWQKAVGSKQPAEGGVLQKGEGESQGNRDRGSRGI